MTGTALRQYISVISYSIPSMYALMFPIYFYSELPFTKHFFGQVLNFFYRNKPEQCFLAFIFRYSIYLN